MSDASTPEMEKDQTVQPQTSPEATAPVVDPQSEPKEPLLKKIEGKIEEEFVSAVHFIVAHLPEGVKNSFYALHPKFKNDMDKR